VDVLVPAHGDLPEYTRRTSRRASRVRLTVTAREGLVVVVPVGLSDYDPARALRERGGWIRTALDEVADRRAELSATPAERLPAEVEFAATGERWSASYRTTGARSVRASVRDGELVVAGAVDDADACLRALNRWLQRAAAERLLPLLADESVRIGISPRSAAIRGQRARWGGCSAAGAITLNRCLLFLPSELVGAVILHELAHVAHPDHSPAFWAELRRLDPAVEQHRVALRAARHDVPAWAEP
jgi:predicted metal-dependent hydrolase